VAVPPTPFTGQSIEALTGIPLTNKQPTVSSIVIFFYHFRVFTKKYNTQEKKNSYHSK